MKRAWLLILAVVIGAGLLVSRTDFDKALPRLFVAEDPVISAFRYTLEVEVAEQHYLATSVAQTLVYSKPDWQFEIGTKYFFRFRGEGLGIRFADGRVLAVKYPRFREPPGYDDTNRAIVERFAADGRSYPVELNRERLSANPTDAFVFDDAAAPRQAWRLDWMHPERTLGPGARIVRFDMTPTHDPPTFDLGKIVPWVVVDRRKSRQQMIPGDEDVWFGFDAFRAKFKNLDPLDEAKEVVLTEETHQTKWLDASDRFSRGGMSSLLTEVEPISVRYSEDFGTITLLGDGSPTVAPTLFVQRGRMKRREPANPVEQWTPVVCILHTGCADILSRPPGLSKTTGALINPASDDVYIARRNGFNTANTEFQKDYLAP
jgi:hypothetical protein